MSLIYFYDATQLDKRQISDALASTDHHWEFVDGGVEPGNCNSDTEVISVFVTSTVSREIIEALPKLKLIACRSTGFNNIDLQAAADHGVTVVNVPTYGESTVAEYAFTILLALQRRLLATLANEGNNFDATELVGNDLSGKVFGVIGTGHIGQKAIKIANGFSMEVIAFDAFGKDELQEQFNFKYMPLEELLQKADFVSLHLPYLPSTHHIINAERLALMKPGAVLINTARGELVDNKALVEALDSGRLGGAALDVLEGEAMMHYHEETALLRAHVLPEEALRHSVEIMALKKLPNVIVTPHNAFNTVEAIERINQTTAQNVIDFWYGNTPNKVEQPKKQTGKLLVARHAESEWNATGRWTGITDVHLSDKGFHESALLGQALKELGLKLDAAYCSQQIRTRETLEGMLDASQQFEVDIITTPALNERDYGEYTGKNKWEIKELLGEEAFNDLRRGWEVPVPGGETLKMVYERVVPFYKEIILPMLREGKNVLLVGHGNSIRALMKFVESISDQEVSNLEMLFGQIIVYDVSPEGLKLSSSITKIDTVPPKA